MQPKVTQYEINTLPKLNYIWWTILLHSIIGVTIV